MPDQAEQGRTADCTEVAELLPVYLNRSLDAAAARRVESHLATCAACRREERDTRTAWALYEGHLPVELLLDYALGQPLPGPRREVVESHLAVCGRCAEELATVRQEQTLAEPEAPARRPAARARRDRSRILAWAACLAAVVASAGWMWTWRQLVDERLRASATAARANLTVVELLPATQPLLRRGRIDSQALSNRLELPEDADELVLVLLSGGRACAPGCLLEIYEVGEAPPKHRLDGLLASPDDHVTLALPSTWLSPGRSVLILRDQASDEPVVEYLIEIQPQARPGS